MSQTSSVVKYVIGGTVGCIVVLFVGCIGLFGIGFILAPKIPAHLTRNAIMDHDGDTYRSVEARLAAGQSLDAAQWTNAPQDLIAIFNEKLDHDYLHRQSVTSKGHSIINGVGVAKVLVEGRADDANLIELEHEGMRYYLALRDWGNDAQPTPSAK
jgi:hypothetical protein